MTLFRLDQKWMKFKFYLPLVYFMIMFQELASTGLLQQTVNIDCPCYFDIQVLGLVIQLFI